MGLAHFLFYGNYSEPCKYHIICGKAAYLARKRQDFRVYGMKYNLKTGKKLNWKAEQHKSSYFLPAMFL